MEIYNEKVLDLLADDSPSLQIREDIRRGVFLENAREEVVSGFTEVRVWLRRGQVARRVGETRLNAASSRSHAVFSVTL